MVRFKFVALGFLLLFGLLTVRLFFWQVIRGKELAAQAQSQYASGRRLSAPRGNILDSDGNPLAARADGYLIYAEIPHLKESPKEVAEKLAPFFVADLSDRQAVLNEIDRIENLLFKKETVWIPVKQRVTPEVKKNIEALGLTGIGFEQEEVRAYPEASAAAHLLGFVGKDDQGADKGYFGLEGFYDLTLAGRAGFEKREADARGTPILLGSSTEIAALFGVDLLTNLDKAIQRVIDKRLLEGIQKYGAKGGTAVVVNPKTGAILASSSYPSYEPGLYWQYGNDYFRDPLVSDSFEPGSVFKIVVMAAALDSGAVTPETICDACAGPLKLDKYTIETWNKKYNPNENMTEVIVHSDNVGMSFVGQKLGADKLYDYLDKFGFGKLTGIDIQGEITPEPRLKGSWNIVDLATTSFGQGIAITPIQMIKAVSIIANGGVSITPYVVKKLQGENWNEDVSPKRGERVISPETASEITTMMVEAAKYGESKWTNTPGFSVAGKTGTAQIPIAGHYDPEKTNASFVGFSPATDPKFAMLVTLKEPQSSVWASETAAPLWYSIAKDLFIYFGIAPQD